ncbi:putative ribonuclease H-like domain-containing protein [Tanacetum coccineum]|uniref:Ribonuclease H-like domain-containing protein n=1 Tax=Tanacetum coccineum TaxID=301880 RepID=A0ABQ4X3I2_9ASTR
MSQRVESSEDQESLGVPEDASKQGRSIEDIDADVDVSLVDETQKRQDDDLIFDTGVLDDVEMHVEAKIDGKDEQLDSNNPTDSTPIPIIDQPSSSSQPKKDKPSKKAQRQEAEVPQDEAEHEESVPTPSNDLQASGEDSIKLTDLMVLCTKLQTHVLYLQKAKDAQAKEIAALKKRIQRLERRKISRPTGLKRLRKVGMSQRVEPFEDQESLGVPKDASKQGMSIEDIDADVEVTLVDETQSIKTDDSTAGEAVTTAGDDSVVPTTNEEITLAQTLIQIKVAKPQVVTTAATTATTIRPKDKGVVVQEPSEFRVPQEIKPSSSKDKGKGIMIEPEVPLKRKDQIALDEQIARDIQAKLDAELLEEQKLARKQEEEANIALIESWENTQAMMEADRLLAERLQSKEREELTDEEKAKLFMELMEKRRKHFAALRAQEKRNRPPTKAQKRTQMSTYLKHMGGYTYKQLKGKSFDEIQKLFDKEMKRVNTFVAMGSEVQENKEKKEEGREETAKGSRKKMLGRKRAMKEQQEESSKKQKVEEERELKEVEEDDEVELKKLLVIKKDEDIAIDAIPLATKLPVIIEYKLHKEGMLVHYELIRADGSSKRYSSMIRMLQGIDREDLEALWRIVKGKYGDTRPEDEFERVLYGDLRVMFEPDIKSDVWRMLQGYRVRNQSRFRINKWYQSLALRNFNLEDMELESTNSGPTAKLPILKLGEYEMWAIRIKQYFQIQDYALWEVIENGDSWVSISQTTEENGITTSKMSTPATAEEKTKKKNDVKARGLLLMALPNEHQLTFSQYPDAKSMFAAIETRFGGNAATKKTQKTLLKQQYENFSATSAESLDSIFNRLQKIVSRLAILGVIIAQEDLNLKFLSSLPPEWNTHVVVWMNKPEIETMSIDDLYNNFKIVEQKIKKTVGTSSGGQNLAFMTAPNSSSTNDANTAYSQVSAASPSVNTASPQVCTASVSDNTVYAFMVENPNGSNVLHQDLEQIHEDDLEAMDLKWQLSLLSVRAKKYYQKTGKKIFINGNDIAGYDKSKVECYNCHKLGHFARECRASRSKEDQFRNQDNTRKQGNKEDTSKAMLAIDGVGFDWSDMAEEQVQTNMALMAFSDSEVYTDKTCSKTCLNNYETLKKQYDDLLAKQLQTKFEAATYKRGLDTVEAQLVTYRKNEVLFSEEVVVLKREVGIKQYEINTLKTEFEKLKQEKDAFDFKIEKFDKASKDLDQLLESQITDKSKKGLGYSAVPPPHPLMVLENYVNGIVERRNRTLVEAARTMLIFSKAPIFLWEEVVATAFFGALCYPTNDSEDLGKLQPTVDIGIFIGYAPSRKEYIIYNKRTRRIMETIHVQFDELTEQIAHVQLSTGPAPTFLMLGQISSGLVQNSVPAAPYVPPTNKELEILFQPMFKEYMEPPRVKRPVSPALAVQVLVNSAGIPSSTTIDQDAPSLSHSPDLSLAESPYVSQTLHHLGKWSKDHPLDNIIGNPSRPVCTRKQLATDALWCLYNSVLSKVKPKNFKSTITEDCWFQTMQDEIHEFDQLQVNTVRPRIVNTARSYRTPVNTVRPRIVNTTRSYRTPVNTVRPRVINTARQNKRSVNAARATGFNVGKPQHDDKGFVDSGCSRHMTGNIAYLSDFKQFDGVKIQSFSVSQMCDKKNYVLFTNTECLVLSPNFKLPYENQILLKIPRKDNMYSFDMKNIVPKESLTCLVAKATLDETMLWHRRLGHINFKNINKLVKDNLVRGLPTKRFENDQTCVACLKGKQHRASCKSKVLTPITKPLFMLHMDLFGPTFMSSLTHKKYCLVVTDDYSRFTWVLFLLTKDETSEIFKNFIKEIENLVDKKVKIIKSDNGTEFKNKVMDDFCREKGIKRKYSVSRTPQQNGVVERRNKTLIEAARTMLADSKLPTTFWAEVVSTACYVQNRVLVVKPHNKIPYELFRGFKPALSFIRPFGCHVTILNTLDSLGKFDGKSDEGFFVGYSLSSKAFRVYNTRTRRVEENLHIEFLENKPMIEDNGISEEISQDCIVMPIWKDASYFDLPTKDVENGEPKTADDAQKQVEDSPNNENVEQDKFEDDSNEPEVDLGNITNSYTVPTTPNTRIHKDHLIENVIGDVKSSVQTRRMTKPTSEQGFPRRTFYNSKLQQILDTVDLPNWKRGSDYEEVFAPVARIEAIRLFLAYDSFMGFLVYQMDVKSAFLYRTIEEEVYVTQPLGFKDPDHPDKVYKVGDEAVHKELGDRIERADTTASSLEAEQDSGSGPRCQDTILGDVDAQTRFEITSKLVHDSHLSQEIQALIDNKKLIITKSSIQSDLHLGDAGGTDCLLTATIFEELEHMGLSAKTTAWNEFSSAMASAIICLATNQKFNFSKYIFDAMLGDMSHHKKIYVNPSHTKKIFANMKREGNDFSGRVTPLFATMMVQPNQEEGVDSGIPTDSHQTPITTQPSTSRSQKQSRRKQRKDTAVTQEEPQQDDSVPTPSNNPLISGEDSMQLSELMILCTNLQKQVLDLEKAKDAQAKEIVDLKKRVQKLERKKKSRTIGLKRLRKVGMSRRVKSSKDKDSLGDHEDAFKQGRSIEDIDKDADVSLVDDT